MLPSYTQPRQSPQDIEQEKINRLNEQIQAINEIGRRTDSKSMHNALYSQYLDLIGGAQPDRNQQMKEAMMYLESDNPMLKQRGNDILMGLSGGEVDPEYQKKALMSQYLADKFGTEFGMGTGNDNMDMRNMELNTMVQTNPMLASQYYDSSNNPNFLDKVGARIGSILPGQNYTYQEILKRQRLNKAGLPTSPSYYTGN